MKFKLLLFSFLICSSLFAQKKKDFNPILKEIKENGYVLVLLKTESKSIEMMRKWGKLERAEKIEKKIEKENEELMTVFCSNFDFCRFTFLPHNQFKDFKEGKKVDFIKCKHHTTTPNLSYKNDDFFILKWTNTQQEIIREDDKEVFVNQGLLHKALVLFDKELIELPEYFPAYVKAKNLRSLARKVRKLNVKLHRYYRRHNK